VRNPKVIKTAAAVLALILAAVIEHYAESLWVVRTPSGGHEFYHGPMVYLSLLVVFFSAAIVLYKLTVRILKRGRSGV